MIQATIPVKYILRQTAARAKELCKCAKVLSLVFLNSSNSNNCEILHLTQSLSLSCTACRPASGQALSAVYIHF